MAIELARPEGLALLRAPVPEHLISPLPKGTKAQNECKPEEKTNCNVCGGWHHPRVRHLDYVGHAAATHLLLDADPMWSWEPLAFDAAGLPKFDESGGLWIRLTVCNVTRLGYGHADKKAHMDAGSREKEVIGDALRNAAMRFGLALELWSKADLHDREGDERTKWLAGHLEAIDAAPTVGKTKEATAKALAEADERDDQEAHDDILIAQAAKMARANVQKPAAARAAAQAPRLAAEDEFSGDDIPH
jgi:hypothetical protein